jgi:hypothetical protein
MNEKEDEGKKKRWVEATIPLAFLFLFLEILLDRST